ncbi:MAG: hypothetical protein WCZ29_08545 [Mycolicibacterium vanbaalenii]|jgi:hypothetical protein|uniref:hypothetical protein n=1 Tax=Mycolicibacterium vanbaalenii TaxID=110539 RepID=UPI0035693AA4
MNSDDDDEQFMTFLEVTMGDDPGHLGDDEPEVRPLCRQCLGDPLDGPDGLCALCRSWKASP